MTDQSLKRDAGKPRLDLIPWCRFQGLAAAIMHEAGWRLAEACYLPGGALEGVRLAAFVHDSFILEAPIEDVGRVDGIFCRILREAAEKIMPDVLTKSEGQAMLSMAKDDTLEGVAKK